MRLLLDTHIALWASLDPSSLSAVERKLMAASTSPLVLSAVSVWELRLKWHSFHISGSRKGPIEPASIVTFAAAVGWELMALTAQHATCSLTKPLAHKDPFDELLLVQAQEEGMCLLTRDAKLLDHPLAAS